MNNSEYCSKICKGKCCFAYGSPCPNLTNEFKCGIYSKWVDDWCNYQTDEIQTAPVMEIIKKGLMNKEIEKQCCYAHPELLEIEHGV